MNRCGTGVPAMSPLPRPVAPPIRFLRVCVLLRSLSPLQFREGNGGSRGSSWRSRTNQMAARQGEQSMTRRQVLEGALAGPAVLGGTLAAPPADAVKAAPKKTRLKAGH